MIVFVTGAGGSSSMAHGTSAQYATLTTFARRVMGRTHTTWRIGSSRSIPVVDQDDDAIELVDESEQIEVGRATCQCGLGAPQVRDSRKEQKIHRFSTEGVVQ